GAGRGGGAAGPVGGGPWPVRGGGGGAQRSREVRARREEVPRRAPAAVAHRAEVVLGRVDRLARRRAPPLGARDQLAGAGDLPFRRGDQLGEVDRRHARAAVVEARVRRVDPPTGGAPPAGPGPAPRPA